MLYTVTSTLPPRHGGRTKSLLSRIALMEHELGRYSTIVTTNYNANYPKVYEQFRREGKVGNQVKFENIYDWLSGHRLFSIPTTRFRKKEIVKKIEKRIAGLTSVEKKQENVIRYYDQNEYVLYRRYYRGTRIIEFEDFMSKASRKKVERWEYNLYGQLHRKITYSPVHHGKIMEELYDTEDNIYCKKFYSDEARSKLVLIQLYRQGRMYHAFKKETDLFEYYFNKLFKAEDILFVDARLLDRAILNVKADVKRVIVVHSSHLHGADIKGSYKTALSESKKVDRYVVLTEHQKQDILERFNISDEKIAVVPHFIVPERNHQRNQVKDQFCFIGRFGRQKQMDHLIKSYAIFKQSGHATKLVLYGMDEQGQLAMMKGLIDELGLQDDVEIHSFIENPAEVFRESKASLLTSGFEGFGLTVMESINVGCPVISYDVKYGPREIIRHGENGYLVPANDMEAFAQAMVDLVEHPLPDVQTKETLYLETAVRNYGRLLEELQD